MPYGPIDASLRAEFSARFQLLSVLGRGAMATVYLAHETPRDRYVALKVLAEPYHGTLEADRFRREARVLTTLRHPNILRAYEVGSQGAHDWYSMPFVAGESLRERLDRERRLPIDEACQLAIDVLAALAHSHSFAIVHRDVKPDNVLLGGSRALLADFGIARRVEVPDAREPTVATAHGVALGTPAYMSPEQIAAERSIDGRSDVYSTAVMLYECLSGTLPITGKSARDFMARHMTEAPVPLSWVAPEVPTPIVHAVQRGLAKAPSDRFQSAAAFRDALIEGLKQSAPAQTAAFGVPAISVAPLEFSGLPQDRWIALGIQESIIGGLRDGKARVVNEPTRDGTPAGRWCIGGSCAVTNANVRITLSVIDRVRGSSQALEPIVGHATDLLVLEHAAARQVRRTLARDGLVSDQITDIVEERSALAEALYLRGCAVMRDASPNAMATAASLLERALQHEPRHVRAIEAQSGVLLQLASPDDPGALHDAIACADRALAIDPTAPASLYHKGMALAKLGAWTEAIEWMERAVAANPEHYETHYALGRCRLMQALCTPVWEHLGRAVRPLSRAIALAPGHLPSYRDLAAAYLYANDDDEANAVLRAANRAMQSLPADQCTIATGLDRLVGIVHSDRRRTDAAVLLLWSLLEGDDRESGQDGRPFSSRVCCAIGPAAERTTSRKSSSNQFHAALSISGANHFGPD
jgi:tetratricopeptide (TPR) repeat protein/tRNA A-37 threonylcarbamoyl transferase component Bud32